MANVLTSTTSVTNAILAKHIEQMIRERLMATLVMPMLVTQGDLRNKRSKTWSTTQWGEVVAAGVNETTSLEAQEMTLGKADITVGEVGAVLEPTDLSVETSGITPEEYADRGAKAIRQKMESDLCGLFTGVTQSVGTTNTELSLDTLIKAIETLETADDEGPYFGVLAPRQVGAYRRAIAGASGSQASIYATGLVDPRIKAIPGFVGDFLGVPLFRSTHVPKANANVDFVGCFFSVEAFGMATLRDVRVEAERNAKARSTAMVATSVYGVGEIEEARAVKIISKVAA